MDPLNRKFRYFSGTLISTLTFPLRSATAVESTKKRNVFPSVSSTTLTCLEWLELDKEIEYERETCGCEVVVMLITTRLGPIEVTSRAAQSKVLVGDSRTVLGLENIVILGYMGDLVLLNLSVISKPTS